MVVIAVPRSGQERTVERYAGSGYGAGHTDGLGTSARFDDPVAIVSDPGGNAYVVDRDQHTIRKIAPDGRVSTVAGNASFSGSADGRGAVARFSQPSGIALERNGNLYVTDGGGKVRKISPQGVVTTLVPSGLSGSGVAVDSLGNVYVSVSDHTIRRITPAGIVSLLAGQSSSPGLVNAPGAAARFNVPRGLAFDASGNLFIADAGNNVIRKMTPGGALSTFAAIPNTPYGLCFDQFGDLLVTAYNGNQIKRITPGGSVTNVAGNGNQGSTDGAASSASFLWPQGVTVLPSGVFLVADSGNHAIRSINGTSVSTLAGGAVHRVYSDGTIGGAARFMFPADVARDSAGNLFVADGRTIRKITPGGTVTTFAGSPTAWGTVNGTGAAARFNDLTGIAIDSNNNLYVNDSEEHTIRKITPGAVVTTLAGGGGVEGSTDATGVNARFRYPSGLTVDASGNVYVADFGNHSIRKISSGGVVTTFAGLSGSSGYTNASGTAARFQHPSGIDVDTAGNFYVADYLNHRIRKITMPGVDVTTLAGNGILGWDDGVGAAASFHSPGEVETIGTDVYVLDGNQLLRKITAAGEVTTVAGRPFSRLNENAPGTGPLVRFTNAWGLGADPSGNLYIADRDAANLRFAQLPGIEDLATVSSITPPVNTSIQLGPDPDSGETWIWDILRRPAGSVAHLSGYDIRNPTFTPDVADLFVILLRVAKADGSVRYSTAHVLPTDSCEPLASVVASTNATEVCVSGAAGAASVSVIGGGAVSIQWGWRLTPTGSTNSIGGATSATYNLNGPDLGGLGTRYLVATVTSSCGVSLVSNPVEVLVAAPPGTPTVSAGGAVYANEAQNFASTDDAGTGATYAWTILNGTINSGAATNRIQYTAGATGEVTLQVAVTRGGCEAASVGTDVAIIARPVGASMMYLVTPCRVVDTRNPAGPAGGPMLASNGERNFPIGGACGIPVGAAAVALNVTAVTPAASGFVAVYPSNVPWGGNSTLNYRTAKTRANNAVVTLAPNGTVRVMNSGPAVHMLIDVTGYFR